MSMHACSRAELDNIAVHGMQEATLFAVGLVMLLSKFETCEIFPESQCNEGKTSNHVE